MAESIIKLNLGCGKKIYPKPFVNVDFQAGEGVDLVHDLTKPLPYADDSVDEIHAYHVFEHFFRWESEAILEGWIAKLKPHGLLVLEVPCLDKIIDIFGHHIRKRIKIEPYLLWGLYGDPGYRDPAMVHKWCYAVSELSGMMRKHGLAVEMTECQTHVPSRDMRLEGKKKGIILSTG